MGETNQTIHDRPTEDALDMANILDHYFGRKVAREYLSELKSSHVVNEGMIVSEYTPSRNLRRSFIWHQSRQGKPYWATIFLKLRDLEQNVASNVRPKRQVSG